ncbi:hypothetical protein [Labrys neptuniae]
MKDAPPPISDKTIRRTWTFIWSLVFLVLLAAVISIFFSPPETPAQKAERLRQAQVEDAHKKQKAASEMAFQDKLKNICPAEFACSTYAKTRQDCATAGDFNNCVRIKMGADYGLTSWCTDDGNVTVPDPPTYMQCLSWSAGNYLGIH